MSQAQVLGLICLVSSIPCCSCQGLLSSFTSAVHWKGTASGSAGLSLFVFLAFSYVTDTGSRLLPVNLCMCCHNHAFKTHLVCVIYTCRRVWFSPLYHPQSCQHGTGECSLNSSAVLRDKVVRSFCWIRHLHQTDFHWSGV